MTELLPLTQSHIWCHLAMQLLAMKRTYTWNEMMIVKKEPQERHITVWESHLIHAHMPRIIYNSMEIVHTQMT